MQKALVTGGAGFIGSHLIDRLLKEGWQVDNLDNFDSFYDARIKWANVQAHLHSPHYRLFVLDLRDYEGMCQQLPGDYEVIIHLAARAGVRPSIQNPILYQEVNVRGTQNLLELAREWGVKQFLFASSSSFYGVNPNVPWREDEHVLMPISPYAATKVAGELLGHVYSHLYGIRFIALRFFTVYGPRQRPDLAIHKFARLMLQGKPIPFFGDGSSRRDYTYIDDIVQGIMGAIHYTDSAYEVINLGHNEPVSLNELVQTLAEALGVEPILERLPDQPGDVPQTWANIEKAKRLLGYQPMTPFREGIRRFVEWLRQTDALTSSS